MKKQSSNITTRNLYIMLCYALDQIDYLSSIENIGTEQAYSDKIEDLFAYILDIELDKLFKKGLMSKYELISDNTTFVKGKINTKTFSSREYLVYNKFWCEYDSYSPNNMENSIIKLTIKTLLLSSNIAKVNKNKLKQHFNKLNFINDIRLNQIDWNKLYVNRFNKEYKFILNICYLILASVAINSEVGNIQFSGIQLDKEMHNIFEKFVLNYYKYHYDSKNICVSSKNLNFSIEGNNDALLLPRMETDICIEDETTILIIDTKYYKDIFTSKNKSTKRTLQSANIYQINTYIESEQINQSHNHKPKNVIGCLFYAKPDNGGFIDQQYIINGKHIDFYTLDLNKDWKEVRSQLDYFIRRYFPQIEGSI